MRLAYNRSVRAYFAGEPGAGVTRSIPVEIGVRPQVTARSRSPAAAPSPGDRIAVRAASRPAKRTVLLLAERRSRGTYRRVVRRAARSRNGARQDVLPLRAHAATTASASLCWRTRGTWPRAPAPRM